MCQGWTRPLVAYVYALWFVCRLLEEVLATCNTKISGATVILEVACEMRGLVHVGSSSVLHGTVRSTDLLSIEMTVHSLEL